MRRPELVGQRALDYSPKDPIAYFLLGNVNRDLYNEFQSCGYIKAAAGDYVKMISLTGSGQVVYRLSASASSIPVDIQRSRARLLSS